MINSQIKIVEEVDETLILDSVSRLAALSRKHARKNDLDQTYAPVMWAAVRQSGLAQLCVPESLGGAGASVELFCKVTELLAAADCCTATLVHLQGNNAYFLEHCEDRARADAITRECVENEWLTAYALTEPGAGSDALNITATATPDGDGFRLNGIKCFSSWASMADAVFVMARIVGLPAREAVSCFFVRLPQRGFTVSRKEIKLGLRGAPLCEIMLDDLWVPRADCLGERAVFKSTMKGLDYARIGIAAMSVGLAQGALDYALRYVLERKAFGRAVADFQGVQFKLADMATTIEAARQLTLHAARLADTGQPFTKLASMAKYYASDVAMHVTTDAVQLLGGHGYTGEHPVERMMRDAKGIQIFEGANELQRDLVFRAMKKEVV